MQGIDVIILIIVAVLLLIALYGSIRHFKGEGPCCGGTSSRKSQEKQLMRPVIGRKILRISGMHAKTARIMWPAPSMRSKACPQMSA